MDQVWTRLINLQNNLINIYIAPCGVYSMSVELIYLNMATLLR